MKFVRSLKMVIAIAGMFVLASCAVPSNSDLGANANGMGGDNGVVTSGAGARSGFANYTFMGPNGQVNRHSVYFGYDNDDVKACALDPIIGGCNGSPQKTARALLTEYANYLSSHGNLRVRLEGNTDARGSREYNIALGERRANSVSKVLQMGGVSPDQISVVSFGKEKPDASALGNSERDYSINRRVDLIIERR